MRSGRKQLPVQLSALRPPHEKLSQHTAMHSCRILSSAETLRDCPTAAIS